MKTALSILCSLVLAWAQIAVSAQTPTAPATKVMCGCGGKMHCCAAQSAPAPHPSAAAPVPPGNQNQLSTPPQNGVAWFQPDAKTLRFAPMATTLFAAPFTALYARDCARLI